jgi:transcriptional regulator with XRE-family HTH domain
MGAISETLRKDLLKPEFSEGYSESFQDALVATQIKVLREDNHWTQADLAAKIGTTQTAISRIENVNYSAWNISTLKKLARAFRVRLKVSFETYGSLLHDVDEFSRESLRRAPREEDPELDTLAPGKVHELKDAGTEPLIGTGAEREAQQPEIAQIPGDETKYAELLNRDRKRPRSDIFRSGAERSAMVEFG